MTSGPDNNALQEKIKVTLLGTGTPTPSPAAFGTSTLVEVAGLKLLFDCGRGATIRLVQAEVATGEIDAVFLSHYHSDHYSGLADFAMTGSIPFRWGGRTGPLDVYGPAGLEKITDGLWLASEPDHDIRVADSEIDPETMRLVPHVYEEGVIFEKNGVTVRAILVDHGDHVKPAYAFRVDYAGRCFVHSGDTRFNENLIEQAAGADVFVHEVAAADPELYRAQQSVRTIIDHHITPDRLGEVLARVQPRLAILTHLVLFPLGVLKIDGALERIAEDFDGTVIVAEDLMTIHIGKAISVVPFAHGSK